MKLGLLYEVGTRKAATRKEQFYSTFLCYEHKSLQDFGASTYVTERLETAENIQVNTHLQYVYVKGKCMGSLSGNMSLIPLLCSWSRNMTLILHFSAHKKFYSKVKTT